MICSLKLHQLLQSLNELAQELGVYWVVRGIPIVVGKKYYNQYSLHRIIKNEVRAYTISLHITPYFVDNSLIVKDYSDAGAEVEIFRVHARQPLDKESLKLSIKQYVQEEIFKLIKQRQ